MPSVVSSFLPAPSPAAPHVPGPAVSIPVGTLAGTPSPITHAPYRREPYIRCRTPSSSVIDGKAAAWTRTAVLLHWMDDLGRAHNRWVPATAVQRVSRDESSWQDPYDDWSFYYPELPAALPSAASHSAALPAAA